MRNLTTSEAISAIETLGTFTLVIKRFGFDNAFVYNRVTYFSDEERDMGGIYVEFERDGELHRILKSEIDWYKAMP